MSSVKTCDLNSSGCVQFSLPGASDSHTMVSVRSFLQRSRQVQGIQVYQKVLDRNKYNKNLTISSHVSLNLRIIYVMNE